MCIIAAFTACEKRSELATFEREAYLNNPDNLLGNRYQISANIDATLAFEADTGRLIAVRENPDTERIPLFISKEIVQNIHVGQRYRFEVEVKEGGLVSVSTMEKF